MARFDKVDPIAGSFRAKLGFQPVAAEVGDVIGVNLSGTGTVIKSVASADAEGVIVLSSLLNQGDTVDVMTHGEVVDVTDNDNITGRAAGATVFAAATGALGVTAPGAGVNGTRIGRFVENWRLIVRVQKVQG